MNNSTKHLPKVSVIIPTYNRGPFIKRAIDFEVYCQMAMALGRFAARRETENARQKFVMCLGVPRYLLKGFLKDVFLLVPSAFNRLYFYNRLRGLFRKAGMIKEYRLKHRQGRQTAKE
jgi:glycosyltransferase involved in cell wall biosynthesis